MALVVNDLADKINEAIDAVDKDEQPITTTDEMKAYAEAIITTLEGGVVLHSVPGTVTGTTAPNSAPLVDGEALGGLVTALLPSTWSSIMLAEIDAPEAAANIAAEATASTTYIMTNAEINFDKGSITGICSSVSGPPPASGPLLNGAGTGGYILGLDEAAWAAAAAVPIGGDPAFSEKVYKAIVEYLENNLEAQYTSGSVQGTCPAPPGTDLLAGLALGGTIA